MNPRCSRKGVARLAPVQLGVLYPIWVHHDRNLAYVVLNLEATYNHRNLVNNRGGATFILRALHGYGAWSGPRKATGRSFFEFPLPSTMRSEFFLVLH